LTRPYVLLDIEVAEDISALWSLHHPGVPAFQVTLGAVCGKPERSGTGADPASDASIKVSRISPLTGCTPEMGNPASLITSERIIDVRGDPAEAGPGAPYIHVADCALAAITVSRCLSPAMRQSVPSIWHQPDLGEVA
jgi:hypothetical protein